MMFVIVCDCDVCYTLVRDCDVSDSGSVYGDVCYSVKV